MTGTIYTFYTEPRDADLGGPYSTSTASDVFGTCGDGVSYQANVQTSSNPHFKLLTTAPKGEPNHWPELAELVAEVNEVFEKRAQKLVDRKRTQTGFKNLELTIHLAPDGLRLIYALAAKKKKPAYLHEEEATAA